MKQYLHHACFLSLIAISSIVIASPKLVSYTSSSVGCNYEFTANSSFTNEDSLFSLMTIPKSVFPISSNYSNLDSVSKLKKLELGVGLPEVLLQKVNNFVREEAVPNRDKLNPYLDWELRVYAEFKSPSTDAPFVIDGFYTKDFSVNMPKVLPLPKNRDVYTDAEYAAVGGWTERSNAYPFRIRFAPPEVGSWQGILKIEVNGVLVYSSESFKFTVIESGNPGYVRVGVNKRYLRRENTFFPIGCNLNWPETTMANDPLLAEHLSSSLGFAPEGYRETYCIPRVYDKYKEMMTLLSKGGGNYFRWIMYPVSTEIEWEKLGDYTKRLHMAQEMDEIVEHAEELDLFIHWNLQIHYSLQKSVNAYYRKWAWDFPTNGAEYCYKTLVNSENPMEFFTDITAKRYYKQRLRYILARWGYSTNVAVWELFSEISNVGAPEADNNEFYMQGTNWTIYRDWQVEMAEYIKSMYHGQCHLVTASFGGEKHPDDNTFESPYMDIMTSNIYDFEKPDFGLFAVNKVAGTMLNDSNPQAYTPLIAKPMIFSEMDPIDALCDKEGLEVIRNIWQCTFSGLAGALSWDMQITPDKFNVYGQIRNFIEGIDLDGEGWHPGAVDQVITYDVDYSTFPPRIGQPKNTSWYFNEEYAKFMDGFVDPPGNPPTRLKRADLIYLRSGNKDQCIGVVSNKTYNIRTESSCFKSIWDYPAPLDTDSSQRIETIEEDLILRNLNFRKRKDRYLVNYFDRFDQNEPIYSQQLKLNQPKMDIILEPNTKGYLILFRSIRTDPKQTDE